MPISKKEINKEMMFNKIMPSGFASKKIGEANAIKDSIQEAEKAEKPEEQELKNLGKARNKKTDEPALHADIKPSEKAVPDKPLTIAEEEKPKEDNSKPLVLNGDTAEDVQNQEKKASKSRSKKKNAENEEENTENKQKAKEDEASENEEAAEPQKEEKASDEDNKPEEKSEEQKADEQGDNSFMTADKSGPLTLEKKPEENAGEEKKPEPKAASNQPVMVNIYEKMVLDKVDAAIAKFKCCSCYLCHQDIVTMALNNLKPKYIVAVEDDLPNLLQKENASEVTSAIMKAILHVKANPRH